MRLFLAVAILTAGLYPKYSTACYVHRARTSKDKNDGKALVVTKFYEKFTELKPFQSGTTQISVLSSDIKTKTSHRESSRASLYGVSGMNAESGMIVSNVKRIDSASSFPREGDFTLAVIRVRDNYGHSPDYTAAQISDNIFGTGSDTLNMVIGYQECSGNKVNFGPATGAGFSGGVMELAVTQNIHGALSDDVEDYVTDQLSIHSFDPTAYTNVMYVFPREVDFQGATAYAYLNGYLTVISNHYVSKHYVLMHQIGHNFGQYNSGGGTAICGDDTDMMGIQEYEDNAPRACFNGAKSWWFGWYSDRHAEMSPTSVSTILNMLSIDDYLNGQATSDDQYTVVRIVGTHEIDLFVMYNRAEGVNSQVSGHRDQVTIVRQNGDTHQSWLEAGLSFDEGDDGVHSQWTKSNWNGSGKNLVIHFFERVVGAPDYARVSVYLQGVNDL